MNAYLLCVLTVLTFLSCSNDDDSNPAPLTIIGQWELIEQLIDPGDGSGTFNSVNSDKTMEFFSDSSYVSNGPTCTITAQSGQTSGGTYNTADKKIFPDNCTTINGAISYELNGDELILHYICIEPCSQKFSRKD